MKKAGIVIINYNSMNYLKITLSSLLNAKTNIDYAVGVIDNGSLEQDSSKLLLKKFRPNIQRQNSNFMMREKISGSAAATMW